MFSVQATVVVSNGLTHIHESSVGNTIRGRIEVKNIGELPEKIIISKQDILKFCNPGSPDNPQILNHDRSLNDWIDISVLEKELSPGEEFSIIYDIAIPENDSLLGSYWTMVIVEIARPIKRNQMEHGFMIDSKIRYGIQVITNIGSNHTPLLTEVIVSEIDESNHNDSISPSDSTMTTSETTQTTEDSTLTTAIKDTITSSDSLDAVSDQSTTIDSLMTTALNDSIINEEDSNNEEEYLEEEEEEESSLLEFVDLKLDKRENVQFVYTKLENYDIFLMNIAIIIDIYDEFGEHIKKIETPLKKLYPGSCIVFEIPLHEIPAGDYDAIIVADYGKDLYGINVSLTIDEE